MRPNFLAVVHQTFKKLVYATAYNGRLHCINEKDCINLKKCIALNKWKTIAFIASIVYI